MRSIRVPRLTSFILIALGVAFVLAPPTVVASSCQGGGRIFNPAGITLVLKDCTVSDQTGANGGGIENYGHLILMNVTVSNNSGAVGGGIYNGPGGTLELHHVAVQNNQAIGGSTSCAVPGIGGGLYSEGGGTVTLDNVSFLDNHATYLGGGVFNASASGCGPGPSLMIGNHITISGNSSDAYTGGLSNGGLAQLSQIDITNNTASLDQGGVDSYGVLTIDHGTIKGNTTAGNAAGIFVAGYVTVSRTNIINNTAAGVGGGVDARHVLGTPAVFVALQSTISGNTASDGGGIEADCYGEPCRAPRVAFDHTTVSVNKPDQCDSSGSDISCSAWAVGNH